MPVAAVPSANPAQSTPRSPRRVLGTVEKAARKVLRDIDSDHAAEDLLTAVATRLARDVDEAEAVRDRVAASRELLAVLEVLDTAVIPPKGLTGSTEGGAADDDDPFEIGAVPPSVVDTQEPQAG